MENTVKSLLRLQKGGTPRTLDEAIMLYCPHGVLPNVRTKVHAGLRDFLAQRFGAAYLQLSDNPEGLQVVQELFEALTNRPAENSQLKIESSSGNVDDSRSESNGKD